MSPIVVEFSARQPDRLARWWADALGWDVHLGQRLDVRAGATGPTLRFTAADRGKDATNGVHLDLRSGTLDEQRLIVGRLIAAGARTTDVGQAGTAPWVVLADPEDNEFCVLEPRADYNGTGPLAAVVVRSPDPAEAARWWQEETDMVRAEPAPGFASLRPVSGYGTHLEFLRAADGPDGMLRVLPEE